MTDCTKRIIVILLLWISQLQLISSSKPYCEFDLCDESEYCCKPNTCCPKPSDNIAILAWILAAFLLIALACTVLYKCKSRLCRFYSRGSESELINPKVLAITYDA